MREDDFKKETKLFITQLNNLLHVNCEIIFDITCQYPCCFDPTSDSIILNNDLLNQTSQSALNFLGEYYLKYFILHEYGHIIYNNQVKNLIKNIMQNEKQTSELTCFIQNYNLFIERLCKKEPSFLINTEHYWVKQYKATCEFMADYFVIQQINKNFNYLNSTSFKLWRANEVLEQYNYYHRNDRSHIEVSRYYHIPETITNNCIIFENDSITLSGIIGVLNKLRR